MRTGNLNANQMHIDVPSKSSSGMESQQSRNNKYSGASGQYANVSNAAGDGSSTSIASSFSSPSSIKVTNASSSSSQLRVRALYDCEADYEDEISFKAGDIIIIKGPTNDPEWLVSSHL